MKNDLTGLTAKIEDASKQVSGLLSTLTDKQLNWKPSSEKWSVGECIEHLVVTNRLYFPILEKVSAGGYKNSFWQKVSPFSGFFGNFLLKAVSPDTVKKMKTASVFTPVSSSVSKKIINDFTECNKQFISYLQRLGSIDLKKTKIASPVSRFITYSLEDALNIITIHEARHINQAKAVTLMEEFPKE